MAQGYWQPVYDALTEADRAAPLSPADLERLATAAGMLGRQEEQLAVRERLYRELLESGETLPAARAAFWLAMAHITSGEMGPGLGWIGRVQRIVQGHPDDCAERGYLLLPQIFRLEQSGEFAEAADLAAQAVACAERFGEPELFALANYCLGHMLIRLGRIEEGCQPLDDAMVSVTTGEVPPFASGIVYCGVILACQDAFDLRRAREWTAALSRWCERQPDMVAFTGRCLVHRAEILQREGEWPQAIEEARVAAVRCDQARNARAAGEAAYVRGELHRLQGDLAAAEEAYREASRRGREPQPGHALLRATQGDVPAAAAALRRALAETTQRPRRAALLPAAVEVLLLADETAEAREACAELEEIAAVHARGMLAALAAHARGAVALVEDDPVGALPALRHAVDVWLELDAPYDAARSRVLLALACRALGDEDTAAMELDAARGVFERLGAADVAEPGRPDHGLTARELEVLRLVAAGRTNKAIATELVLSERTVHRHVSNIFTKLRVSTRAAATAYAYEHELV